MDINHEDYWKSHQYYLNLKDYLIRIDRKNDSNLENLILTFSFTSQSYDEYVKCINFIKEYLKYKKCDYIECGWQLFGGREIDQMIKEGILYHNPEDINKYSNIYMVNNTKLQFKDKMILQYNSQTYHILFKLKIPDITKNITQNLDKINITSNKKDCTNCKKQFTKKTIDKYNGICGCCNRKINHPPINKKLKEEVWKKRFNTIDGYCYTCNDILYFKEFECAHIISIANGGKTIIDNLEATCKTCNRACGTMNLDEFKENLTS